MNIKKAIKNPYLLYAILAYRGRMKCVPDKLHLRIMTRALTGKWPDFKSPQTFNEKLQWLKLYDRNPLYVMLADKNAVKQWVSDRIGSQHVTKTFGCWSSVDDIDIESLPDKFVLKTNHDCGGVAICANRSSFDLEEARRKLRAHMEANYFWGGREWPYKQIKPCVFAEEFIESNKEGDLPDYKLFVFNNGRIITLLVTNRFTGGKATETFFDEDWKPVDVIEGGHPRVLDAPMPRHFEEMKRLAARLAGDIPFVRVDFYESGERLLFGEMTFYPNSGFEVFVPEKWNSEFGSWISLPERLYSNKRSNWL